MSKESEPGPLRRVLRWLLTLLALGFVAWAARGWFEDWQAREPVRVQWVWVAGAGLAVLGNNLAQALAWAFLLRGMSGTPARLTGLVAVYAASHLGRYVPGKVALAVIRAEGAERLGVAGATVYSSIVVELISWLAAACAVASTAAMLSASRGQSPALPEVASASLLAGVGALTVALLLLDRRRLPERVRGALKLSDGAGPVLPWRVPLWHVLQFLCWGTQAVLLGWAVGASSGEAFAAVPFFVLAPASGMVAVALPAGLGVREAVMVAGLSPAVGPAAALTAAALSRALALGVDLALWAATRHRIS